MIFNNRIERFLPVLQRQSFEASSSSVIAFLDSEIQNLKIEIYEDETRDLADRYIEFSADSEILRIILTSWKIINFSFENREGVDCLILRKAEEFFFDF